MKRGRKKGSKNKPKMLDSIDTHLLAHEEMMKTTEHEYDEAMGQKYRGYLAIKPHLSEAQRTEVLEALLEHYSD